MNNKLSVLFTAMFLTACASNDSNTLQAPVVVASNTSSLAVVQAIPKPSEMSANVIVNARVSTVKNIDVAYVGKQIPFTFSDGKVSNTEGFEWYVSKHFALKTDYPAKKAKFFLELLELSYPYYVEFFGMEPPNIENQRIASTYATSNDILRTAMFDDGFNRGIHHTAGGEAMYYNWVGYSFPTERPQHQRYISIHETMHSYQMALGNYPWTPSWHGEGLGDATANHIFDSEKKQLTVFGHDVPIFDMMSWGIAKYKEEKPSIVEIHDRPNFDRGLNVLFVQFMMNSPENSQYLKIYHQEVMRRQTDSRKESLEILQDIVPDWDRLEADFTKWVATIDETHEVASRGQWEIDGNMFYKRKSNYEYPPQRVGFTMTPSETPTYGGLFSLDFPTPDASELLLDAKRGVAEPIIAYELEYQKNQLNQGTIGMAFGVESTQDNLAAKANDYRGWKGGNTDLDEQLRVEIKTANTLIINAKNFGGDLTEITLPVDITASLSSQEKPKLGVSVQMKSQSIEITVKAANAKPFIHSFAVTDQQYQHLVNRPFGLVSVDNQHGITPHIDDGRDLNPNKPDYNQQTAANAWGFAGDKLAQRFARAAWKAGKETPASWRAAFAQLNAAALNPTTANAEIAAVEALMPALAKDGSALNEGLAELSGIQLQVDWLGTSLKGLKEYAIITNHSKTDLTAQLNFEVDGNVSGAMNVKVKAGERSLTLVPSELLAQGKMVTTTLDYQWYGQAVTQVKEQKTQKYNGYEMPSISADYTDGQLELSAKLHAPYAGKTEGDIYFDLHHDGVKETHSEKFSIKPYEERLFTHKFKIAEKTLDHNAWYEITIIAEVDGEPVTLRKRLPYIPEKFTR